MKKLLTLRRYQRKQAGLSHNREWYIIDTLLAIFISGMIMFVYNLLTIGFTGWL